MSIKAGLRALALGVAMVWGATGANAVVLAEGSWNSADGPRSINQTFRVLGTLTEPTSFLVDATISGGSEFPIDLLTERYDIALGVQVNGVVFTPNTCLGGGLFCRARLTQGGFPTISPENMTLVLAAQFFGFTAAQDGSFSGGLLSASYQIRANLPAGLSLVAETPIPAALPLFASVLGAGGLLGYRRKRAQRRAAAVA